MNKLKKYSLIGGTLLAVGLGALGLGAALSPESSTAATPAPTTVRSAVYPTSTPVPPTTMPVEDGRMSAAEFRVITPGMWVGTVKGIVGSYGEVSSMTEIAGHKTEIRTWTGVGGIGANAIVMFQDGLVISKSQAGLR